MVEVMIASQVLGYQKALIILHYWSPFVVAVYFFAASALSICLLQALSSKAEDKHVRRDIVIWLKIAFLGAFVLEAITILVTSLFTGQFCEQDQIIYVLTSVLVWGVELMILLDTKSPVWHPYYGSWFIGLALEGTMTTLGCISAMTTGYDTSNVVRTALQISRLLILISLVIVFLKGRSRKAIYDGDAAERQSLLGKKSVSKPASVETSEGESSDSGASAKAYGATATATTTATETATSSETAAEEEEDGNVSEAESEDSWLESQRKGQEQISKRLKDDGNWWAYVKGFAIFFPFFWPVNNRPLQLRVVLVGICLLSSNALNVLTPRQLGIATDALVEGQGSGPWIAVSLYIAFRFLNSGSCLGLIQKWLWLPRELYSYNALSTAAHSHVMNLSSEFHDSKTSSEITSAISQGQSVSNMLETILFQLIPMLIDLLFAYFYLHIVFGPYMALITAFTSVAYLYLTSKMIATRSACRREYITLMRKEWVVAYQGLDGWRSASLFNNIPYEEDRYSGVVKDRLKSEKSYRGSYNFMAAAQGLIMTLGLLGGSFLAIYQVTSGSKSAGSFVTLLTYWGQLSTPLAFFSRMYSDISNDMITAERLLELFQTKPSIVDAPNAKPLKLGAGKVNFNNVIFSYDKQRNVLNGVNFEVAPGSTVALVGETGGGKSTVLKLLNRFYDVTGGSIEIDNQDLRDVTLSSLRDKMGVVPQDPTLFNDTIMNNIRYARLDATDAEVHAACEAAAIHKKIMTFPNGYNSKVGERGVKLSGGEQQRVAIARAILKRPEIVLLDEATSAVDTETEELIQKAFRALCAGRTTFIVAHRLSTIMRADKIMVMKDGQIVESGSHDELIKAKGKYQELWSKQIFLKPITEESN